MNCIKCEHKMEQADQFTLWCPQCGSICSEQHDLSEHWQHPKNLGEGEAGTGYALLSDVRKNIVDKYFIEIPSESKCDCYLIDGKWRKPKLGCDTIQDILDELFAHF